MEGDKGPAGADQARACGERRVILKVLSGTICNIFEKILLCPPSSIPNQITNPTLNKCFYSINNLIIAAHNFRIPVFISYILFILGHFPSMMGCLAGRLWLILAEGRQA
jgi:hypothetical protein